MSGLNNPRGDDSDTVQPCYGVCFAR